MIARDYRLNPEDAVLERAVPITRVTVWVPVMPTTVVPAECFGEAGVELTWRRYAFERAHVTFLNPHRPSGPTFQALKRLAFWPTMYKDFNMWIHTCAVSHQIRTVRVKELSLKHNCR